MDGRINDGCEFQLVDLVSCLFVESGEGVILFVGRRMISL